MAENVLRLRVDSQEYDSKIKRAAEGLRAYVDSVRRSGSSMSSASADAVSFTRAMGSMVTQAKNVKGELREYTNALNELTTQYRALSDEERNSPIGQAMAQSIQQLTERAGAASDAIGDVAASIQHAASDTRAFDEIAAGVSFATSTFQTFQGAAELVGIELGDNVEVLAKLQAAMAVTNGLMTIQNALQKNSALMIGITTVQTRAKAAAEALATKGTRAATIAQAAFNAVASANPYVLLAVAVLGVAGARVTFSSSAAEATEIEEDQISATDQLKKKHEEFAENLRAKVGERVGETVAKFSLLQAEWNRLKTVAEQKQWIDANQSAFRSLGLSVTSVNDAFSVFVSQAPQVINALIAIAEAEANKELYKEAIKKREQIRYDNSKIDVNEQFSPYYVGQEISENDQMWKDVGSIHGVKATSNGWVITSQETADRANRLRANIERSAMRGREQEAGREAEYFLNNFIRLSEEADKAKSGLKWFTGGSGFGNFRTGRFSGHGSGSRGGNTTSSPVEEAAPVGSLKAYEQELVKLKEAQKLVTNNNDWQYYAGQIAVVEQKMKEIRGEVEKVEKEQTERGLSGVTSNSLNEWMSGQQAALANAQIGSKEYKELAANILDAQTLQNVLMAAAKGGMDLSSVGEELFDQILDGKNIDDTTWQSLVEQINTELARLDLPPIVLDVETGDITQGAKDVKDTWQDAAAAVQSVGQALQKIEDPSMKIAGLVGEAIANIALGFAQATAVDSRMGVFGWIAAIAGGIGTMMSTISAIKSATAGSYASGGVVPGNNFSGDNVPVMVNSGETILTRAQSGIIANALQGGVSNLYLETYISGEDLRIAVSNANKRRGRGEYAYSKTK